MSSVFAVRRVRNALLWPSLTAMMLSSAAIPALAQSSDAGSNIEDVVVSATRREEALNSVPLAVSVVDGDWARERGLNNIQDISSVVPSLNFRTGASNKDRNIFIRGVGTITSSGGVEPSVSTVIDGVVYARPGQATLDLLDVDQIEVLRGPQGTLFGKNASAGAINVTTAGPSEETRGYLDTSYYGGDGNEYRVQGSISGAIVPGKVEALISGVTSGFNGNVTNLYDGGKVNGYTHNGGRAKVALTLSPDVRLTLAGDFLVSRDSVPTGVFTSTSQVSYPTGAVSGSPALASILSNAGVVPSANNTAITNNTVSHTYDENGGTSATLDWAIGDYALTSISAHRYWKNLQTQDYDQVSQLTSSFPSGTDKGSVVFNQFSEEVRLASPKGGFIDYVVGAYYMRTIYKEVYQRTLTQQAGSGATSVTQGVGRDTVNGSNYALFGEANINFTDNFRGIAGVRGVRDELDYHLARTSTSATAVAGINPSFSAADHNGVNGYSARLGLQYDVDSNVNTYFTYSRGYMGPAFNVFFNMVATSTVPLKPETSNAYEIGLKGKWLGGLLQTNLAAYIEDFDNFQANFTDVVAGGLVTRLINAGSVSTRGVEADATAHPIENLTLQGSLAWTEARVDHFSCPPNAATSCNIDGQPLPFAPDWRFNLLASYLVPVTEQYGLTIDTNYAWQSKQQSQLTENPDTIEGSYGIWNAGLTLANLDSDPDWSFRAQVKNIADTHYSPFLGRGTLAGVVRWVPRDNSRYFGIGVRKDF